jgi:hypothetical protein
MLADPAAFSHRPCCDRNTRRQAVLMGSPIREEYSLISWWHGEEPRREPQA